MCSLAMFYSLAHALRCAPPPHAGNVRMHLVRHERAISPFLFVKFESYALAIVDGRACCASREDVWRARYPALEHSFVSVLQSWLECWYAYDALYGIGVMDHSPPDRLRVERGSDESITVMPAAGASRRRPRQA